MFGGDGGIISMSGTAATAKGTALEPQRRRPSAIERVATAAAAVRFEAFDAATVVALKIAVLDCLAVMIAGADEDVSKLVGRLASCDAARPEATIVRRPDRAAAASAALANGTMAHACDYDDSSFSMWGHATAPVLAAVLAMAEHRDASGSRLLTALAAGLEVEKVFGLATQPGHYRIGWHPTGTLGVFGATAGAAHVAGLDATSTAAALGIAASRAAGVRANVGTMVKPLHVGFAARDGVEAVLLAELGVTSSGEAFDGADGFLQCYAPGASIDDAALSSFGAPFEVLRPGLVFKLYPCCADLHASVDAILELRAQHGIDISAVRRIHCGVTPLAAGNAPYPHPKTPLEAKFSQQYVLAAALVRGRLGLGEFEPEAICDPTIDRIRLLVEVEISPALSDTGSVSFASPAEVEIELLDGRRVRKLVRELRGHPRNPLSVADIEAKFVSCTDGRIDPACGTRILDAVRHLDCLPRVRSLGASLAGRPEEIGENGR
jgi:2-methylcitrate dehydratase PrpD